MATRTKLVNLDQLESLTTKLGHITSDCRNHNQMTTLDVEKMLFPPL